MKKELIDKSIETGELQLTFWQKAGHYGIAIYLSVFAVASTLFVIKSYLFQSKSEIGTEIFSIILAAISFLLYRIQRRKLKLIELETQLTREILIIAIDKTAEQLKWTPYSIENDVLIAKTNPGFWSGSWGEQITIFFENGKILINSICDPDGRSSIASFGGNDKNVNTIIREINAASRQQGA